MIQALLRAASAEIYFLSQHSCPVNGYIDQKIWIMADNTMMTNYAWNYCPLLHSKRELDYHNVFFKQQKHQCYIQLNRLFTVRSCFRNFCKDLKLQTTFSCTKNRNQFTTNFNLMQWLNRTRTHRTRYIEQENKQKKFFCRNIQNLFIYTLKSLIYYSL